MPKIGLNMYILSTVYISKSVVAPVVDKPASEKVLPSETTMSSIVVTCLRGQFLLLAQNWLCAQS